MKKILLKRVLPAIGGLILLLVLVVVTKFFILSPKMRPPTDVKAPNTPEAIERGKYLANHVYVCLGCHSKLDDNVNGRPITAGMAGSGRDFGPDPLFPGRCRTHNLTPDKNVGIGNWTDGEVLRAMREGVGKDGHALFPMMPYTVYREQMSDADALAIIAYLRTLPPLANDPGKVEVIFPVSMFIRAEPKPVEKSPPPMPTDPLEHGKWLIAAASCNLCHDSIDAQHQKIPGKAFAGGAEFDTPKGRVFAANISSDKETGIGAYSDEDILKVINEGINKAGRPVLEMPWMLYKGMTDEDKKHMVLALRAAPPVKNLVPPPKFK